jgi:hypothetical protein
LIVSSALLLLITLAFAVPPDNQTNFFHAAVVLLSVPAGASILSWAPRPQDANVSLRRAVLIGTIFLPTVLVLLSSYAGRPPVPAAFDGPRVSRTEEDSGRAALYRWVRAETPAQAVFVLDPCAPSWAFCGNTTEFPACTGRSVFTERLEHYLVSPYPEARRRVDLAADLVAGEPIDPPDIQYLQKLGRPLYLVVDQTNRTDQMEHLNQRYGSPVFRNDPLCVFRWR